MSHGGGKSSQRCQSGAGRQVAAGSAWLLLSPWGAGACLCATKPLCRKMLLAFSNMSIF